MIRVPGKAAVALLQALLAAFVVSSRDGHAQDRPGDRAHSIAVLGASIAEAQRSPFHRVGPAGSVIAPGAQVAIMPPRGGVRRTMLQETGRATATDEASKSEVFLATALVAHLSQGVGYVFVGTAAYATGSEETATLLALSGVGLAWLGTSLPAAIMWREFGRSLAGSSVGVVLGPLVGVALGKLGVPFFPAYSLSALVHAGAVTLVAGVDR